MSSSEPEPRDQMHLDSPSPMLFSLPLVRQTPPQNSFLYFYNWKHKSTALYSLCLIASVTWERIIGPKSKDFRKGDEWPSPGLVLNSTARCVASGQENTHPLTIRMGLRAVLKRGAWCYQKQLVWMYRTQNSSRLAIVRSMFSCIYTSLNTFSWNISSLKGFMIK